MAAARASPADRLATSDQATRKVLAESFRRGLSTGLSGPVIDMEIFAARWDVSPEGITAPVRLWIGDCDNNVPRRPARALAQRMRTCEVIELRGHGHFWIVKHYDVVLEWLAAAIRADRKNDSERQV